MKSPSPILATKIEFQGKGGSPVGFLPHLYSFILQDKFSFFDFTAAMASSVFVLILWDEV